jgi:DNA-binding beta-propeller fold protein YncE
MLLTVSLMGPATAIAQSAPLVLETKIPLGAVIGRIDHLDIDARRQRLFVAELGNDSLGVVDLAAGKVLRTMAGFSEPQGVAYVSSADSVYVANGGDGSVRVLRADDLAPIGRIELGDDTDNVRVDPA